MSAHRTRVSPQPSLEVIEGWVYRYVKKIPHASVDDVVGYTGLMGYQITKAWKGLVRAGKLPGNGAIRAGKSPGRPKGMTGDLARQVIPRECDTIAAFLMNNPGTSVRAIAKHTGLATWRVYRARKIMEKCEEVGTPPRWGKGRQHATYTNFLLTVLAPV